MTYNILNGDSLASSFPDANIQGNVIVVREGLIEGDLSGDTLQDFWKSRAAFVGVPEDEYRNRVVTEFEKILAAPDNSEFNLWFEYDLFCQVHMWFVISLINTLPLRKKVYAVYSSHVDRVSKQFWTGFGQANSHELTICFHDRILLRDAELRLGRDLWTAYKSGNLEELTRLAKTRTSGFPYLQEVVVAHVDRFPREGVKGRPERVIEEIINNISTDVHTVMKEFWNRESIYGFGDIQLQHLYDKVMRDRQRAK